MLRHGESEGNARRVVAARALDPPLIDVGVGQATLQAERLSSAGLAAIHASPLLRTRQTAAIASERCGLPVGYSDVLWEVDVGDLDGRTVDEETLAVLRGVAKEWEAGRSAVGFPGGETLDGVYDRFHTFLASLGDGHDGPILVVGHGVLFMAVLWAFCTNPQPKMGENTMGRGHLSIVSGSDSRFDLLESSLPPGGRQEHRPW